MVAFISALSLEGKAPSTTISYIAGVAYMHKVNNWQDPTKSFILQKSIEGSKRLNGSSVARAFPGERLAHPEDQNEEENEENLRKNERNYGTMRKY